MQTPNDEGMQWGERLGVHETSLIHLWIKSNPHMVWLLDDHWLMSSGKPMREVVAANIQMLMAANPALNTNAKLSKRSGASLGTIGRVRLGRVDPGVETINQIASAFGIEGWALMVEGWTPDNPPVIRGRTETERELYERLSRMVEELKAPAKRT